jgi:hypothetical protein
VLHNAARVIPLCSPHVCYDLIINNESGEQRVSGCNSIYSPESLTDASAVLSEVLLDLNIKNPKANFAKAQKKIAALTVKPSEKIAACEAIVAAVFTEPRVTEEVRLKLREANGWFIRCPTMRAVGKGLFCMGFHNRENVLRTLETREDGAMAQHWFEAVGHGAADERIEDFRKLYFTFRQRDHEFLEYLKELARENPARFFDEGLRPVALRCLGVLNRDFFANFCNLDNAQKQLLPNVSDSLETLIDGEKTTTKSRVVRIGGHLVTASTVSLCRSLLMFDKAELLRFSTEAQILKRPQCLLDCEATLSGRGNSLREAHALCATKRLCLVFDETTRGHTDIDALKTRYMDATAPAEKGAATVYVRDVQLLRCKQLAHVLWRAAGRAAFTGLVFTMRFEYDPVFCGSVAPFLAALASRAPTAPEVTETVLQSLQPSSVKDLLPDTLSAYSGILIVPVCRDAVLSTPLTREALVEGTQVFTVSPPLFGSVLRQVSARRVLLKLAIFAEEIVVPLAFGTQNLYRSIITNARGILVPVSALAFQRKKNPACYAKATVFVPRCFSASRQKDLVDAAKAFFVSVTVVAVDNYALPLQDMSAAACVVDAIAQTEKL